MTTCALDVDHSSSDLEPGLESSAMSCWSHGHLMCAAPLQTRGRRAIRCVSRRLALIGGAPWGYLATMSITAYAAGTAVEPPLCLIWVEP
jgi:hypothetical protein